MGSGMQVGNHNKLRLDRFNVALTREDSGVVGVNVGYHNKPRNTHMVG